jgi:uncharacterized membrane-anchored protein
MHREADRLLPDRGSVLMLAAQTAQLEGKEDEAHLKFRQMLRSRETELLGLRGLLAQAVRTGDQQEALSLARRAYRRSPTAPWVLTTLFDLLTRAERWGEAMGLVPELVEQKLVTENDARRHRAVLHHMQAVGARDENRPHEALKEARRALRLIPPFVPSAVLAAGSRPGWSRTRGAATRTRSSRAPTPASSRARRRSSGWSGSRSGSARCGRTTRSSTSRWPSSRSRPGAQSGRARRWSARWRWSPPRASTA